jgi:hypothetical protein
VRPDMMADHPVLPLDLFQVAALAGGAGRAADAAIVSLADHGLLRIKVSHSQFGGRFYAEGSPPAGAHPVELALHATAARPNAPWLWEVMHEWEARAARRGEQAGRQSERMRVIARARQERGPGVRRTPGASYANLCHEVRPAATAVQRGLQQLGLLRPGQRATRRRPQRTPIGQDALDAWRHSYQAVKDGAGEETDLALAVAIWGLRTLWNTRLRDITEAISPMNYGTD